MYMAMAISNDVGCREKAYSALERASDPAILLVSRKKLDYRSYGQR
jgi:hypothetical protein